MCCHQPSTRRCRNGPLQQVWISDAAAREVIGKLDEARDRLYRSMTVTMPGGVKMNRWGALPLAVDAA